MKKALYWQPSPEQTHTPGVVVCRLCPHRCVIPIGQTGKCLVRENRNGTLYATSYGLVSGIGLDPIEKKPLTHFYPGSQILSIGGYGCNLRCPFCQNHEISMEKPPLRELPPAQLGELAVALIAKGNTGVAYTYNEPTIHFEYVYDCSRQIKEKGLKNVMVTNAFLEPEPLKALAPYMDAMNIDLKGFTPSFYHWVQGSLDTVKNTIQIASKHCHVEVTTLVIPGKNDNGEEMDRLSQWLASVDPCIPLHITRFFPRYRFQETAPTPKDTLLQLQKIAKNHLKRVYIGNV